ncbi:WD40/YVTN/BNR-like repeat-containing protein [Arenimonas fontis]|uniref:DUF6242 domain-containing protein n=1 Tax=Arenimonas fontis TaxID=2608255 RepID=A0A5B2ZAH5_9GAMM|nr:hypothetical protein [Arenimonas fontis]KAA2285029.1 hypothetical protein F0415_07240 [Arenimonas fontis]
MRKTPNHPSRLAGALLLALALPLAAQVEPSGDPATPPGETMSDQDMDGDGAPEEATPAIAANDPSILDAEPMPKAARSLLLDVVRTPAGFFAVGERGHVLGSEDGRNWTQLRVPTRSTLTAVAAYDGVLWAAGHDGVIVHSTDGGQTWTRRRAAPWTLDTVDPSEGVPIMDLLFVDGMNGYAVGAYALMLVTRDGGVTWEPRTVVEPGPVQEEPQVVADEDNWTFDAADLELEAEADPHLNAIARTEDGSLVIVGERGAFFRSTDGGQTWERKRLPYEGSMFGVLSWGDQHLLAFGLRGNVLESHDLGDSWQPVDTGTGTSLMGGQALPEGGAVLVGSNGLVLMRPYAGAPFVEYRYENQAGEAPSLAAVLPDGQDGLVLVGDRGAGLYRPPAVTE